MLDVRDFHLRKFTKKLKIKGGGEGVGRQIDGRKLTSCRSHWPASVADLLPFPLSPHRRKSIFTR